MFVLRERSAITGGWTTWFFKDLSKALSFARIIKTERSSKDNTIYLTRENYKDIAIYSRNIPVVIWRF